MVIFTSICANYLHKARILAKSVKSNISDAIFIVCLVEDSIPDSAHYEYFDDVILAKQSWEGNFKRFIFKHTIVEASTAVKGQFLKYLYNHYVDERYFIYLDPDIKVYADFTELRHMLAEKPVVVCPHLLQPGNIDMELSSAAHGVYNLGFLAVSRSCEAIQFINWWSERLYLFCYDDKARGMFTDQKWIDLAPCFFDVGILKHRGYDFAPWSLFDCGMYEEKGNIFIKGDELRFIHFSGFGKSAEECMAKWLQEGTHPFKKLYKEYSLEHSESDSDGVSKSPWSYSVYTNGETISNEIRVKYRSNYDIMFTNEDPFCKSDLYFQKLIKKTENPEKCMLADYARKISDAYKSGGVKEVILKVRKGLSL